MQSSDQISVHMALGYREQGNVYSGGPGFKDRVSLSITGWPGTCHVNKAGFEVT